MSPMSSDSMRGLVWSVWQLVWYGGALAMTAVVWRRTARLSAWKARWAWRSGAIAFGFTTLPLGRDGEGMLVPVGWFYLSRGAWFEAARGATILIGLVWATIFTGGWPVAWLAGRARAPRK